MLGVQRLIIRWHFKDFQNKSTSCSMNTKLVVRWFGWHRIEFSKKQKKNQQINSTKILRLLSSRIDLLGRSGRRLRAELAGSRASSAALFPVPWAGHSRGGPRRALSWRGSGHQEAGSWPTGDTPPATTTRWADSSSAFASDAPTPGSISSSASSSPPPRSASALPPLSESRSLHLQVPAPTASSGLGPESGNRSERRQWSGSMGCFRCQPWNREGVKVRGNACWPPRRDASRRALDMLEYKWKEAWRVWGTIYREERQRELSLSNAWWMPSK